MVIDKGCHFKKLLFASARNDMACNGHGIETGTAY